MGLDEHCEDLPVGDERLAERVRRLERVADQVLDAQSQAATTELSAFYGKYVTVKLQSSWTWTHDGGKKDSYSAYIGKLIGEGPRFIHLEDCRLDLEGHPCLGERIALAKSQISYVVEGEAP